MKQIPWRRLGAMLALLAGLGVGLVYSWVISPLRVVDSVPLALRSDFKDQYRSAIAAAYAGTGNLERAKARLSLLGDPDSIEALNAQAQRMLASGEFTQADQLAFLSSALQGNGNVFVPPSSPTAQVVNNSNTSPATLPTLSPSSPTQFFFTETPEFIPTQTVIIEATPRPTQTPVPTIGAPFKLIAQESICDSNLPDGLLQVLVLNSNRRQMPGVEIKIKWDSGEDQFFTGLKPELGNGYADFLMTPDISYTVQLARGSDIASGLIAPACESANSTPFTGGFKLTFQQP